MTLLLGIDIGTSSAKAALVDAETAQVLASAAREVAIHTPQPGRAEQRPDDWVEAATEACAEVVAESGISPGDVAGIGFSGQMHGTVLVGADGRPVRPAIIWADGRSGAQASALAAESAGLPADVRLPGPPVTGFMGPTLRWLAEHEPESLARARTALLPKDYVRLCLTGGAVSEPSDAASTWLFDVRRGAWSPALLGLCHVPAGLMPPLVGSAEVVGGLRAGVAEQMGLPAGVSVVAGCADQPAQALGYGLIDPATDLVTIGTGGQVFHPLAAPLADPAGRLHVFNHAAPGRWYALAAILAAGLSLRWLRDTLGLTHRPDAYAYLSALAAEVPPGAEGLIFLPYLAGERTPHMDPQASGAFVGLRLHHGPGHLARAVMEGVALAMADCLAVVAEVGEPAAAAIASGGAATSPVWRQIQADVYGMPLLLAEREAPACVGAALLAGVGCGVYGSLHEAAERLPAPVPGAEPDPARVAFYAGRRERFRGLYAQLEGDMHALSEE